MRDLKCEVRVPKNLSEAELLKMFSLFERYYEALSFERFVSDLGAKDSVLWLTDSADRLCGFSTLKIIDDIFEGQARRALFSGDTIVDHRFWGQSTMVLAWCRLAGSIKAQNPQLPLFWFLICKGHRTYRYLHCFTHTFYPTWRSVTPHNYKRYLDFLAQKKFGGSYDPARGIVDFGDSLGQLRSEWSGFSKVSSNRDVQFFLRTNPECHRGAELVCLTELEVDNLRGFARAAFLEGLNVGQLAAIGSGPTAGI